MRPHFSFCALRFVVATLFAVLFINSLATSTIAQNELLDERGRAARFLQQGNYAEAFPILDKLATANPKDGAIQAQAGLAAFGATRTVSDEQQVQRLRLRARTLLLKARELGVTDNLIESIIAAIPPDGSGGFEKFSDNKEADKLLRQGEAVFARGDYDGARKLYEQAFALDPKSYTAALFAGDMYFKMGYAEKDAAKKTQLLEQAGVWFAKAIAVDPNVETAYRYWGSALMTQGKMDDAREKVVEAYITNPYTRLSPEGLGRWGNMMGVRPAHPDIEIPVSITRQNGNKVNVTLDEKSVDAKKNDGSSAWMTYGLVRAAWANNKFKQEFPNEKTYRHTLREEAEALRAVLATVDDLEKRQQIKTLNASLAVLRKLEKDNLLEAYILLARPDEGIAQDYFAYKKANADKLRRYVNEYILATTN